MLSSFRLGQAGRRVNIRMGCLAGGGPATTALFERCTSGSCGSPWLVQLDGGKHTKRSLKIDPRESSGNSALMRVALLRVDAFYKSSRRTPVIATAIVGPRRACSARMLGRNLTTTGADPRYRYQRLGNHEAVRHWGN